MSESVACALEHTGGKEVEETVRFIRMVDKFFDCLNVTNLVNGKRKRKSFQSPYVTRFAKTLQLHTSDFSTLVTHNSRTIKDIAVKFLHIVKQ